MEKSNSHQYTAIGLMSGTSLDGLDIIAVHFQKSESGWTFDIIASDSVPYSPSSREKLVHAPTMSAADLMQLHIDYGQWIGKIVVDFINNNGIADTIDVIGSHGHTVLHQPQKGYTLQIGSGADIATLTGIPTVCDLRANDVAAGGQGAPIVPIGERYLFQDYNAFLNIGGIANIAFHNGNEVTAYDVCPGNTPLNELIGTLGFEFDKGGLFAGKGLINESLLSVLEQFSFYQKEGPRSLHTDLILEEFMPMVASADGIVADKLATVVEHIALQISKAIQQHKEQYNVQKLMVTGGGAFNIFLIERIKAHTDVTVVVPDETIVKFKEALIMAFFAIKRIRGEVNCLQAVTGAQKDTVGGAIYS
ncbi:MAG: anhydro-N-acetylmuramic acid kinase [Bacteroidetes bacterium]|nr:anhydro-N-acetylmuramic acid kinase [Bacteroidota bacterium]